MAAAVTRPRVLANGLRDGTARTAPDHTARRDLPWVRARSLSPPLTVSPRRDRMDSDSPGTSGGPSFRGREGLRRIARRAELIPSVRSGAPRPRI
jgi:hypothetical protein